MERRMGAGDKDVGEEKQTKSTNHCEKPNPIAHKAIKKYLLFDRAFYFILSCHILLSWIIHTGKTKLCRSFAGVYEMLPVS